MAYAEFNGSAGGGIASLFQYAQTTVPFYPSLLFFTILMVITLSIYFNKKRETTRGDFPVAFAVGNTVTTILAVIMSMISNFISSTVLGIFISLSIVSYIWLFYSEP